MGTYPAEVQKLYNSTQWKKLRKEVRDARVMCERCNREGRVAPGEHVHHLINYMRDGHVVPTLFFKGPFELLCGKCHRVSHGRETVFDRAIGVDGFPVDPRHPFNAPVDLSKPQPKAFPIRVRDRKRQRR